MKENTIETIAIIGLGALGVNFAQQLNKHVKKENIRIIADSDRIKRYEKEGIYYNDVRCDFQYVDDTTQMPPVDLALFCTKFGGLEAAMESMKHQIGPDTLIMSAINGISSEQMLARMYKKENIIYTVAQGMDATKVANKITCHNVGELCFGKTEDVNASKVEQIAQYFTTVDFPYSIKENIIQHQWSKFMFNVGLNQVIATHKATYELIQHEGEALDEMINAMREVMALSEYANIHLGEQQLQDWLLMSNRLSANGKPSMAQDVDAKRLSEVELFSGTVIKLAKEFGVKVPVNEKLYQEIKTIEANYAND